MMLTNHIIKASTLPPNIPQLHQKNIPTINEINTTAIPIEIETLDPISILLSKSSHICPFLGKTSVSWSNRVQLTPSIAFQASKSSCFVTFNEGSSEYSTLYSTANDYNFQLQPR
jgi:hypothetical protein